MDLKTEQVFHKIRLQKHDSKSAKNKTSMVCQNGISANSWLTPIGIERKEKSETTIHIHQEIRSKIQERARSANGIMGRRHFELGNQEIKKGEFLQGVHIPSKNENEKDTQDQKVASTSLLKPRPATSFIPREGRNTPNRQHLRRFTIATHSQKRELPNLQIRQLFTKGSLKGTSKQENSADSQRRCVSAFDVKSEKRVILNDQTISFRSFRAMKEAYDITTKSAEISSSNESSCNTTSSTTSNGINQEDRSKVCNSKLGVSNRENSEHVEMDSMRSQSCISRSMLRPLLFDEELDIQHSAGCPYSCKGCFRACLASDDYFEKVKNQKAQLNSKKK